MNYAIASERNNTLDCAWDCFAIPYGEITVKGTNGNVIVVTNKEVGLAAATAIQTQYGSGGENSPLFDMQLLPYCPVQDLIMENGVIQVQDTKQYSLIQQGDTVHGVIFNVSKGNFSFDLTEYQIAEGATAIEKKVNNECDKWRLTSPNYSNYFDFSVEKNGGVNFFNVDCFYKPFSPYIHVNPSFSGLYGQDFNDPRGLVCGGDFSLTQINDAWVSYELQNKNYQATFDRQIQNMEVQHSVAREQETWSMIAGVAQSAVTGGGAGMLLGLGGPASIGIGAATGGLSLAAGLRDLRLNNMLRNEALDYSRDQFGYQLGNVQALPTTLAKITAINENNKIFPILEYYTATEQEKEALRKKIQYNGMTVMAISTINDFLQESTGEQYIKGQLIRIEGEFYEDYHIAKRIAYELNNGIYFGGN